MRKILFIIGILLNIYGFSTNKYWGGTGNSDDANHWYTDSTFSTTTTVPGSGDNAYFTKAAGNVTCTVNGTLTCLNFDCHGWGGGITSPGEYGVRFYGNVYLNGTITTGLLFSYRNTSGTSTFTSNGVTIPSLQVFGAGGTLQLIDNLTISRTITIGEGILNINGKIVSAISLAISASTNNSSIIMGNNSSLTLTANTGLDFLTNNSKFSFTCNTSTIHLTSSNTSTIFKGGGFTFYNVYFDGTTGGAVISGNNIFTNLKLAPSTAKTYQFTDATTQTVTGDFIVTGSSGKVITIRSTAASGTIPIIQSAAQIGCSNDYVANGVTSSYYGVSFAQVGGVGSGYLGVNSSISTGTGAPTGWNLTVCPAAAPSGNPFFGVPF